MTDAGSTARGDIRVLLADDHPIVRAGVRAVLEQAPGITVVAEAGNTREAVERARLGDVDVVLMDLQFGPQSDSHAIPAGAVATEQICSQPDAPKVLVLTTYGTDSDILSAIEAGAIGYQLKDTAPDQLIASLRDAAAGRTALAPEVAQRLVQRVRTPGSTLSEREVEVLRLVADGLSNAEIGTRLFLSQATVKTHLQHIFGKLNVSSRTAAVAAARQAGLLR